MTWRSTDDMTREELITEVEQLRDVAARLAADIQPLIEGHQSGTQASAVLDTARHVSNPAGVSDSAEG